MPARHIVKPYVENGYYHIYSRGVEKRTIFQDEQDCKVFLFYIRLYLSPVAEIQKIATTKIRISRFIPLNLSHEVDLISFALMPNHIHLLVKQYTSDGIVKFTRRLVTSYVMYFNRKYKRLGGLFQSSYKGILIESEPYLLHLSRYIHHNPMKLDAPFMDFTAFSSYPYFLGEKYASWVKPQEILAYFSRENPAFSYKNFIEDNFDSKEMLGELVLEDDG